MLEWLLGAPWSDLRSGELIFIRSVPLEVWGAVALGAAGAVAVAWRGRGLSVPRRLALLGLQGALLAGVLAVIAGPALSIGRMEPGRNRVALLVDSSRSMTFGEGSRARVQVGLDALRRDALTVLESRFTLEWYVFDRALTRVAAPEPLPPPGEATHLHQALLGALRATRATPLSGLVVLTDGRDKSGGDRQELLDALAGASVPVHPIGVGRERMPEDLELIDVRAPARVLGGSVVVIEAAVRHATQGRARLVARAGSEVVAEQSVDLDPKWPRQPIRLELEAPRAGLLDLDLALDPLPGERILENNRVQRVIEVEPRARRVLYLEGEPRWEYKFLRRALREDPAIELVSLLRTTRNKLYRQGVSDSTELATGFPESQRELFGYDALVIGSFEAAALRPEQHEWIRDFVGERGGGLLLLAGPAGLGDGGWGLGRVAEVLPATLLDASGETFARRETTLRLTPNGRGAEWLALDPDPVRSRKAYAELPPVADRQAVGELKLGAVALLETADTREPVLLTQRYGRGRSAILATSGTWRWHMRLPTEDSRHRRFWRQLLRYLAAPAPETLEVRLQPGEGEAALALRVDVRDDAHRPLADAVVTARISGQGGGPLELEVPPTRDAGLFERPVQVSPGDLYQVDVSVRRSGDSPRERTVRLRAPDAVREEHAPTQDRAFLEQIAATTGGRYWTPDDLRGLPEALRASPRAAERIETLELWGVPAAFLVLCLLKGAEWLLRRRFGVL